MTSKTMNRSPINPGDIKHELPVLQSSLPISECGNKSGLTKNTKIEAK